MTTMEIAKMDGKHEFLDGLFLENVRSMGRTGARVPVVFPGDESRVVGEAGNFRVQDNGTYRSVHCDVTLDDPLLEGLVDNGAYTASCYVSVRKEIKKAVLIAVETKGANMPFAPIVSPVEAVSDEDLDHLAKVLNSDPCANLWMAKGEQFCLSELIAEYVRLRRLEREQLQNGRVRSVYEVAKMMGHQLVHRFQQKMPSAWMANRAFEEGYGQGLPVDLLVPRFCIVPNVGKIASVRRYGLATLDIVLLIDKIEHFHAIKQAQWQLQFADGYENLPYRAFGEHPLAVLEQGKAIDVTPPQDRGHDWRYTPAIDPPNAESWQPIRREKTAAESSGIPAILMGSPLQDEPRMETPKCPVGDRPIHVAENGCAHPSDDAAPRPIESQTGLEAMADAMQEAKVDARWDDPPKSTPLQDMRALHVRATAGKSEDLASANGHLEPCNSPSQTESWRDRPPLF